MISSLLTDDSPIEARGSRILGALALALPLMLYIPLLSLDAPNASAARIVDALFDRALLPSPGYPVYWLLGLAPAKLDFGSSHFNVALLTSALPTALASWLLYRAARHLDVSPTIALCTALIWATGQDALTSATQAHVHGLSALFFSALFYASLRYVKDPGESHWLFRYAGVAALATAHQPGFFGAWAALALMIALTEWRIFTRPKLLATFLAALLAAPLLYLLLYAAQAPEGVRPDIAYIIERDPLLATLDESHLGKNMLLFWRQWFVQMFPGAPLFAVAGAWKMTGEQSWPRRWLLVILALLSAPITLTLLADLPDANELIASLLAPLCVFTAVGLHALADLDVWKRSRTRAVALLAGFVTTTCVVLGVHIYHAVSIH